MVTECLSVLSAPLFGLSCRTEGGRDGGKEREEVEREVEREVETEK